MDTNAWERKEFAAFLHAFHYFAGTALIRTALQIDILQCEDENGFEYFVYSLRRRLNQLDFARLKMLRTFAVSFWSCSAVHSQYSTLPFVDSMPQAQI